MHDRRQAIRALRRACSMRAAATSPTLVRRRSSIDTLFSIRSSLFVVVDDVDALAVLAPITAGPMPVLDHAEICVVDEFSHK